MTDESKSAQTFRARWVWTRDQWVLDGRVTCLGGRIVSVRAQKVAGEIDLGDQLLLPGLVNAHTHLEFSGLAEPIPYQDTFADWIRNVVAWRRKETDASQRAALRQGLRESRDAGVSLIGEISTGGWGPPDNCRPAPGEGDRPDLLAPRLVIFDEILGLRDDVIRPQMADACQHLMVGRIRPASIPLEDWHPNWTAGLSPHAPYSLSRELFSEALTLAGRANVPVAMHIAETREELEFLASGTGPLAELFAEWGLWRVGDRAAFGAPLQVLQQLAGLKRVLVIHGNYLGDVEFDFLTGRPNFSVVYCPRTHAHFGHQHYPLARLLSGGIRVALGTDSRASNPDLNLLQEMKEITIRHPEVNPATVLKMGTCWGAEALGRESEYGRIEPGMCAAFAVVPIPQQVTDPYEALWG